MQSFKNLESQPISTHPIKFSLEKHSSIMFKFCLSRIKAIRYALEGWLHVLHTQKNSWVHAFASLAAILMGLWLHISLQDWSILILTIAFVWMTEFINTAIETITDLISPEKNQIAKISKDVSAAAVLIAAGASIIVGLLIFGPPLLEVIRNLIRGY